MWGYVCRSCGNQHSKCRTSWPSGWPDVTRTYNIIITLLSYGVRALIFWMSTLVFLRFLGGSPALFTRALEDICISLYFWMSSSVRSSAWSSRHLCTLFASLSSLLSRICCHDNQPLRTTLRCLSIVLLSGWCSRLPCPCLIPPDTRAVCDNIIYCTVPAGLWCSLMRSM